MIESGKTIATIGMTLVSASETILKALEKRFLETAGKNFRTSSATCMERLVRPSNMVSRTPKISRDGFSRRFTARRVVIRSRAHLAQV